MTKLVKLEYIKTKLNIWEPNFFESTGSYLVDDGNLLQFVNVTDVETPNILATPMDRGCVTELEFQDKCSEYLDKILDKLHMMDVNNNGSPDINDLIKLVAVSQKPEMIKQ